ncbi:hypothetical protein C0J52_23583, partial [Blattella germanica]
ISNASKSARRSEIDDGRSLRYAARTIGAPYTTVQGAVKRSIKFATIAFHLELQIPDGKMQHYSQDLMLCQMDTRLELSNDRVKIVLILTTTAVNAEMHNPAVIERNQPKRHGANATSIAFIYLNEGKSYNEISKTVGKSLSTVQTELKNVIVNGSVLNKRRTGRPKLLKDRNVRSVLRKFRWIVDKLPVPKGFVNMRWNKVSGRKSDGPLMYPLGISYTTVADIIMSSTTGSPCQQVMQKTLEFVNHGHENSISIQI